MKWGYKMVAYDEDSLNFIFRQVMRMYHQRTHMLLSKLGVYPGQPSVLFNLMDKDGINQTELAKKLKIRNATVTVMLKRMEKNDLIYRKTDAEDLRVSRVYLTNTGRSMVAEMQDIMKSLEKECFEGFTTEEKILLKRFLIHILHNLQKVCEE